jgi:hypothetical protein
MRSPAGIPDPDPAPAGTWYMLPESHMQFSATRKQHPWVLVSEWSARTAFGHGCVRTSRACHDGIEHPRHEAGHEPYCFLDWIGWVLPNSCRQIRRAARQAGYRSCCEDKASGLREKLLPKAPNS